MFINGVQCAIFERTTMANTVWSGAIAGYLVAYNLSLFILYSLAPILFRMSSAMFYNLSLLTSGTPTTRTANKISGVSSSESGYLGFTFINCTPWHFVWLSLVSHV
jgi:hypothetical protein